MTLSESDRDHLKWIQDYSQPVSGKAVLDIGCGEGAISISLGKQGAISYTGIDLCVSDQKTGSTRLVHRDLNDPSWGKDLGPFDLVLAFDILEHVDSPWALLNQLRKVMSPTASLILTTPNTQSWERVLRPRTWSGASNTQHKQLFSPYSLKFLVEKAGFKINCLECPIRKFGKLSSFLPKVGGQIYLEAVANPDFLN